jgi:hypothetical protein
MSVATPRTDLPPLIVGYVKRNLLSGDTASRVRFAQVGEMQLKPGKWARFEAEQEVSVQRVEFSWRARFPLAPLVALHVRDWYLAGEGALEVRLWGLPLKRQRGDAVAKGEAIRYLAELPWAPQAMIDNRELEWREFDERTVEVATSIGGERVAVLLHFDATGDIVGASAEERPRAVGKTAVATPFAGEFGDYEVFGGVRVPTKAEVRWDLPDGPFVYFRGRLTELAVE